MIFNQISRCLRTGARRMTSTRLPRAHVGDAFAASDGSVTPHCDLGSRGLCELCRLRVRSRYLSGQETPRGPGMKTRRGDQPDWVDHALPEAPSSHTSTGTDPEPL